MFRLADVRRVHLEVTSGCNARCPMCPRNLHGGAVNPALVVAQLRLGDIETIFPPEFLGQLTDVRFCGNYGDPIVAADLLPICAYLKAGNPRLRLTLHSNGGARDEAWWTDLARVTDCVRFGIDGLADTNHLYRRGVEWERVVRAVRAFITAGGRAKWDFLVFRHNEHQVGLARRLAAELGFARFTAKRTRRFLREGRAQERFEVRSTAGGLEYFLEPPSEAALRNDAVATAAESWNTPGDYAGYLAETPICCKAAAQREIYVSADGLVFPCCFLAQIYPPSPSGESEQVAKLLSSIPEGRASIDARHHPLAEILAGPFFRAVADRWAPGGPERLRTCARQCGKLDFFGAQFAVSEPVGRTAAPGWMLPV